MGRPKSHAVNTADRAEKAKLCYELRLQGKTVREIEAETGINKSQVSILCREAALQVVSPLVEEYRQVEDERLDKLFQAAMGPALNGSARHIEMVIRLSERRAKLWGLDKPIKHDVTVTEVTETDKKLAELAEQLYARREVVRSDAAE